MAITRLATSSLKTGTKYDDFLAGNAAFIPSNFFSIATVTAAGGETSLSFTSIPSTYTHLQIRGIMRDTYSSVAGSANTTLQFNGDSTGANYYTHRLIGNGSSASAGASGSGNFITAYGWGNFSGGSNTLSYGVGICDILDYASTSKNKTVKTFAGGDINTSSTSFNIGLFSGAWFSTSAITSIRLNPEGTAFAAGSTFALYGIS